MDKRDGAPPDKDHVSAEDGQLCSSESHRDEQVSQLTDPECLERQCREEMQGTSAADDTHSSRGTSQLADAEIVCDDLHRRSNTEDTGIASPTKARPAYDLLPNELLFHILSFLDVGDLLSISRVNRLLRRLSLTPLLHRYRLQRNRLLLPPLLSSPCRPSLAELIARSIFLTKTSVVSRRLARSLVSIRLARRLAARPSVEVLVERAVLPKECVPGMASVLVAPGLAAKRKAIERERTKDVLRRWVGVKWRGEVREREEGVRRVDESRGVGRVWRLRRFWERVSRGDVSV